MRKPLRNRPLSDIPEPELTTFLHFPEPELTTFLHFPGINLHCWTIPGHKPPLLGHTRAYTTVDTPGHTPLLTHPGMYHREAIPGLYTTGRLYPGIYHQDGRYPGIYHQDGDTRAIYHPMYTQAIYHHMYTQDIYHHMYTLPGTPPRVHLPMVHTDGLSTVYN